MANFYVTREAVKRAAGIEGSGKDAVLDAAIEAASRAVDGLARSWFIPRTETRKFDASRPALINGATVLRFNAPLISISTFTDQGDEAVTVETTEYRLMPENEGPPYDWLELMDDVTSAALQADPDTIQQSLRIKGLWGVANDTVTAGTLGAAIASGSSTTLQVKNGSLVGVGAALLAGSEQLFVSARDDVDLGVNTHGATGALTADVTDKTVTLAGAPTDAVNVGEVLRIGSEKMLVQAVNSTTSFEVERKHGGSDLAAHSTGDNVFIQRTYTIVRGVNGTTAAAHSDDAALTRYVAPADVTELVLALAVTTLKQQDAGWGRDIGRGESAREFSGKAIGMLQKRVIGAHRRHLVASL